MDRYILLTGAMGAGKSTLAAALAARGLPLVHEPARQILAEQRRFGGAGVPDADPRLFVELMLSRALYFHGAHGETPGPVLFDRGVPDIIAYAELFGLDTAPYRRAAQAYRYAPTAFLAPDWPAIYATDDERKMSYEEAKAFGARLREIYAELGYALLELPRAPAEARADFVMERLSG